MTNPSEQFLFLPSSAPGIFPPILPSPGGSGSLEKPRKRRSRMIAVGHPLSLNQPSPVPRKHANRRPPGPDAPPEITHPCTECGKKFWSWKALFGHMRCHPERQWRGMNPPVNFQPRPPDEPDPFSVPSLGRVPAMTEEEHEVAQCLLMLANGHSAASIHETDEHGRAAAEPGPCPGMEDSSHHHHHHYHLQGHFECSSCKKVFGSHQALGGHRASHKNVKGCFANAMMKIGSLGCSGTAMVTDDANKTAFRESEDPGASRITTQFIMNSSSFATTNQACDVDLSLRLGL